MAHAITLLLVLLKYSKIYRLELKRTMTRLNLLYEMTRGQIDIDRNTYLQLHFECRIRESHGQ